MKKLNAGLAVHSLLSLACLTASCKAAHKRPEAASEILATGEAAEVAPTVKTTLLLIMSGGWGSCSDTNSPVGSRAFDSFMNLVKNLEGQFDVKYIMACLDNTPPDRSGARLSFMGSGMPLTTVRAIDFPAYVVQFKNEYNPAKTYYLGHSYGGWVVLDLLRRVQANSVFTFDPIDAHNCTTFSQIIGFFGIHSRWCTSAPDLPYADFVGNTAKIHNYWQDQGDIHSAPLPDPRVDNQFMEVKTHPYFKDEPGDVKKYAHRLIGAFGPVWMDVCENIMKANSGDPGKCTWIPTDVSGHIVLKNPVAESVLCSKRITPEGTNQVINWGVYVDNFTKDQNGKVYGEIAAVRGDEVYYRRRDHHRLEVTQANGQVNIGAEDLGLAFRLNSDGRTARGLFELHGMVPDYRLNPPAARQVDRRVPEMFCIVFFGEGSGAQQESAIARPAAPEASGI